MLIHHILECDFCRFMSGCFKRILISFACIRNWLLVKWWLQMSSGEAEQMWVIHIVSENSFEFLRCQLYLKQFSLWFTLICMLTHFPSWLVLLLTMVDLRFKGFLRKSCFSFSFEKTYLGSCMLIVVCFGFWAIAIEFVCFQKLKTVVEKDVQDVGVSAAFLVCCFNNNVFLPMSSDE